MADLFQLVLALLLQSSFDRDCKCAASTISLEKKIIKNIYQQINIGLAEFTLWTCMEIISISLTQKLHFLKTCFALTCNISNKTVLKN